MPKTYEPAQIYQAVRSLLNEMPSELRAEAEALLARAESGEKVDNLLTRLARRDPAVRRKLAERLEVEDRFMTDYTPIPGSGPDIPASQCWVCPREGCGESLPVIRAGEDPPPCPKHPGVTMIRASALKRAARMED